MIAHPSFHNINFKQAEKMMETMDQGDVIIRPSSKGENHLTVTWKVSDGIYQHVDVREEGKENAFSLGATLWINSEVRISPARFPSPLLLPEKSHFWHFHLPLVTCMHCMYFSFTAPTRSLVVK